MNAPFKPDTVLPILADMCVGISELKKNPAAVVAAAREQQVAILNRNRPVAYVISPEVWEYLNDVLDDIDLAEQAREALESGEEGIPVSLDDLLD
ncbi:type II toxin-antitoxin system Phd/YefM family antitoxin [Sphingomonas gilva]|uniref:Antitoxin n=1 Tax=Sphingomonas gilva TaxID=2305907 RepID=A0A396RKQ4_9SPHN|nr:type II toxin-antitoxin system prevent-host-death family antitoxin [Sphingomonas gilva]RHW16800.1 type II toxin-antitoxin system Phd/YefM family antitoxin [Sphingomonas gilva]